MSEKRFYLGNNDTSICDRSQGGSDGFNMLTIFKVVDLLNEQQATINKLREILAEAEDMIEVRLAEHYIKEYENIKHHIIGDNDE